MGWDGEGTTDQRDLFLSSLRLQHSRKKKGKKRTKRGHSTEGWDGMGWMDG